MKRSVPLLSLFILLFSYGLFLNQFQLTIMPEKLAPENPPGFNDYKGVINIHTTASTGSGEYNEILEAARSNNLDFIVITDLNPFSAGEGFQGYHDRLLVFTDAEYSYLNSRLLNIMNTSPFEFKDAAQSQLFLSDILNEPNSPPGAGLFILAHPFKPRYKWKGDLPAGIDGIEIINLKAIWQQAWLNKKISFFWTLFTYVFNDRLALMRIFDAPDAEIQLWDNTNQLNNPTIAIAGADAEAKLRLPGESYLKFPSYETLLGLVTNHVLLRSELTGNAPSDIQKISEAFSKGQFYMSLDILADPKGFNAAIETSEGVIYPLGSRLKLESGLELGIQLPQKPNVPFDIIVYRNGRAIHTSNSKNTRLVIHEPGVYRVKVRVIPTFPLPDGKKWIPWIYTNSFYVE